jgi:hypothetical protein
MATQGSLTRKKFRSSAICWKKNHVFCNLGQVRGCPYGISESGIYNQFCVLLGDIEEAEHVSFKSEARKKNGKFVLTKPGPIIAH